MSSRLARKPLTRFASTVNAHFPLSSVSLTLSHSNSVDNEDFRILFEIVPNGLSGENRGHVSIDNLRLRSCFEEEAIKGKCDQSQLKCNESKVAVCIPNTRICDLVDDCDDKEDENLNCGEFELVSYASSTPI